MSTTPKYRLILRAWRLVRELEALASSPKVLSDFLDREASRLAPLEGQPQEVLRSDLARFTTSSKAQTQGQDYQAREAQARIYGRDRRLAKDSIERSVSALAQALQTAREEAFEATRPARLQEEAAKAAKDATDLEALGRGLRLEKARRESAMQNLQAAQARAQAIKALEAAQAATPEHAEAYAENAVSVARAAYWASQDWANVPALEDLRTILAEAKALWHKALEAKAQEADEDEARPMIVHSTMVIRTEAEANPRAQDEASDRVLASLEKSPKTVSELASRARQDRESFLEEARQGAGLLADLEAQGLVLVLAPEGEAAPGQRECPDPILSGVLTDLARAWRLVLQASGAYLPLSLNDRGSVISALGNAQARLQGVEDAFLAQKARAPQEEAARNMRQASREAEEALAKRRHLQGALSLAHRAGTDTMEIRKGIHSAKVAEEQTERLWRHSKAQFEKASHALAEAKLDKAKARLARAKDAQVEAQEAANLAESELLRMEAHEDYQDLAQTRKAREARKSARDLRHRAQEALNRNSPASARRLTDRATEFESLAKALEA